MKAECTTTADRQCMVTPTSLSILSMTVANNTHAPTITLTGIIPRNISDSLSNTTYTTITVYHTVTPTTHLIVPGGIESNNNVLGTTNIALDRPTLVSSQIGDSSYGSSSCCGCARSYDKCNAVFPLSSRGRWLSGTTRPSNVWFAVHFNAPYRVGLVHVKFNQEIQDYSIELICDTSTSERPCPEAFGWTEVYSKTGCTSCGAGPDANKQQEIALLTNTLHGNKLRIVISKYSSQGVGMENLEVYPLELISSAPPSVFETTAFNVSAPNNGYQFPPTNRSDWSFSTTLDLSDEDIGKYLGVVNLTVSVKACVGDQADSTCGTPTTINTPLGGNRPSPPVAPTVEQVAEYSLIISWAPSSFVLQRTKHTIK